MSLLIGYHKTKPQSQAGVLKTFTKTITFGSFNVKNTVKVFDSGIILMGITTTTASPDPSVQHTGRVHYDIYNPDETKKFSDVRTANGNYFVILNKNNNDVALRLSATYNVPKPCSITARLGLGSNRSSRSKTNKSIPAPINSITLNITLYYVETSPHEFAAGGNPFSDVFAMK